MSELTGGSPWPYVIVAYGLTWITLAGYALFAGGRVRRARAALERSAEPAVEREVAL